MTFTFLAIDPQRQVLGVVSASRSLAVGCSVPAIDPAAGVVVSQAWTNRVLRHLVLRELRDGASPAEALAHLPEWDERADVRQVAALALDGTSAAWTGPGCSAYAGHRSGPGWLAIGNLLAGAQVLDAMVAAFTAGAGSTAADDGELRPSCDPTPGVVRVGDATLFGAPDSDDPAALDLADRLLGALRAGDEAGGDARGRQSAVVMVGRVQQVAVWPPQLVVDLRVDDHADPVGELDRLLELRASDLAQPSNGETAPRTTVTPSEALAHQWGVEQP